MDALQPGDPQWAGRYRLLKRLGTGGMGQVFLGQSPSGRMVAVKLIRPELADDPDFRRRFAQEVNAARRVSGIFTASVVDADPDGPQPWLVTAYVAGPSLADAVTARGPMPVESVLTLAAGLAEGLGAVHAAGVVHRDLKPSNVLLASDGPRIIDFGISRAADSASLTNGGGVVGSPGFMSPEQAEGRLVGPPADIFSLGGVLAYAATGEPPFGAGSASALLYRVVYGTAATGHVPAALRSLVEGCLAKDPADRPTSDELLAQLGYAEPGDSWLRWQAAVIRPAGELPATVLDQRPKDGNAAAHPRADCGDEAGFRGPGSSEPGARRAPAPDRLAAPLRPAARRHAAPQHAAAAHRPAAAAPNQARPPGAWRRSLRPRSALQAGVAVAALLAIGTAAAVVFAVLWHRDVGKPVGNAGSPAQHVRADLGTQLPVAAVSAGPPGPRAVVDSYFAAINHRNWPKVWRLGGENLNASYQGMVDGYASTARDVIRSITIAGDHATVWVRAYETSGVLQVYQMDFLIQHGIIMHASQRLITTGT